MLQAKNSLNMHFPMDSHVWMLIKPLNVLIMKSDSVALIALVEPGQTGCLEISQAETEIMKILKIY